MAGGFGRQRMGPHSDVYVCAYCYICVLTQLFVPGFGGDPAFTAAPGFGGDLAFTSSIGAWGPGSLGTTPAGAGARV
jgi:hypothetical protein